MSVNLAAVFIALHSICLVLNSATISWHIKSRNIPAIVLITCLQLMMIKGLVDAIVWGGENYMTTWDGAVWCDIMIRIQIGSSIGCLCAIFMISLNLYLILLADQNTLNWFSHTKRKLVIELLISVGFPCIIMGISYFALAGRYAIFQCTGCQTIFTRYKITIIVYTMWVVFWSVISLIMSCLTLILYFQKRREVKNILNCTNSGLSLKRFAKLLIFCFLVIIALSPFALFNLISKVQSSYPGVYSKEIHSKLFWNSIVKVAYTSTVDIDRWIYIAVSFVSFGLFGMSSEAIEMYKEFLHKLPFGLGDKFIHQIEKIHGKVASVNKKQYLADNISYNNECNGGIRRSKSTGGYNYKDDEDDVTANIMLETPIYKNHTKIDIFEEDSDIDSNIDSPLTMINGSDENTQIFKTRDHLLREELLRDDEEEFEMADFEEYQNRLHLGKENYRNKTIGSSSSSHLEDDIDSDIDFELRRAERELYFNHN